ncbi:MAG TPA: hypothetical protein VHE35_05540 [Kofleriaceae bacterium]|nr:hypothetical protein [Kofleriaceae bacterium]
MSRLKTIVVAGIAAAAIGCHGKRAAKQRPATTTDAGSGAGAGPTTAGSAAPPAGAATPPAAIGWCIDTLARAAKLPPIDRAGVILRGCALCDTPFDPLIAADHAIDGTPLDLPAVAAVIDACGGVCSKTALTALREGLAELGKDHPTLGPWRGLAEACPHTMHADRDAARFASGAWYALAVIGDRLAAARATLAADARAKLDAALTDLVLPLPPRSATGNPLLVPTAASQAATPWLALSIVGDQVYVGVLPFVRLAADGLHLVGAPIYPGTPFDRPVLADAVASALSASPGFAVPDPPGRLDRPIVIAPHGSPAAAVLDVVAAVGDAPSYLAVTAAAPASMWPGQIAAHPIPMAARDPVHAAHLRVALGSGRVAAVDAGGKVLASAALPSPDQPMAARLYQVATAMAPGGVVEVLAEGGTVDDLAALLDAAVRGGAAGLVPAPHGATATGKPRPTFDGPALRKLVAP